MFDRPDKSDRSWQIKCDLSIVSRNFTTKRFDRFQRSAHESLKVVIVFYTSKKQNRIDLSQSIFRR
jgi:hypothetical protein